MCQTDNTKINWVLGFEKKYLNEKNVMYQMRNVSECVDLLGTFLLVGTYVVIQDYIPHLKF